MGVAFVGRGLGMVAAVVPGGVVTPQAIVNVTAAETYRLTAENGDTLLAENGGYLTRHFFTLASEAGDRILTEDSLLIEV
ncbi:MAG: hypothetical protein ACO3LD_07580 [Luminiphilus sp.]